MCHEFKELHNFNKNCTSSDGLQGQCKPCYNTYKKEYRTRRNKLDRERYRTDNQFKLSLLMAGRLNKIIKRGARSQQTAEIIGTSHQNFLDWIEFQFAESMNWRNYGSIWQFDHVIPLSSFDLTNEEELRKAMNWMNIRPCLKLKNAQKHNKIEPWLSVCQEIKARKFLKRQK
jgi:hypothetical protein